MGLPSRLKEQNKQLIVPAYCLRKLPGHSTGRRKWGGARPRCGNGVESQGTPRQIEFAGQKTRKERAEQRELQKPAEGPWVLSKMLVNARVWGHYGRLGESHPRGCKEQRQVLTRGCGQWLFPPHRWEHIILHGTLGTLKVVENK